MKKSFLIRLPMFFYHFTLFFILVLIPLWHLPCCVTWQALFIHLRLHLIFYFYFGSIFCYIIQSEENFYSTSKNFHVQYNFFPRVLRGFFLSYLFQIQSLKNSFLFFKKKKKIHEKFSFIFFFFLRRDS